MKWFCQGKYCAIGVLITVPAEDEISDPSFHLVAARSLDIQLSRGGREFWLLFWVRKYQCCYTLKGPSSP